MPGAKKYDCLGSKSSHAGADKSSKRETQMKFESAGAFKEAAARTGEVIGDPRSAVAQVLNGNSQKSYGAECCSADIFSKSVEDPCPSCCKVEKSSGHTNCPLVRLDNLNQDSTGFSWIDTQINHKGPGAPWEAVARTGEVIGEIEVNFLGGHCLMIPVRKGKCISVIKAEVFRQRPAPFGMLAQLLHPEGILSGHEDAAAFIGVQITALFTKKDLSAGARALLSRCSLRCPEVGSTSLMEFSSRVEVHEVKELFELLVHFQPRRLMLHDALDPDGLRYLAHLCQTTQTNLDVQDLEVRVKPQYEHNPSLVRWPRMALFALGSMHMASHSGVQDVTLLLRHCPSLVRCRLHSEDNELTAALVKDLRSEMKASISI